MSEIPEVGAPQERVERNITFSRDYSVGLPRGEKAYMIPASEWNRVKRMVGRIVPPKNWFQVGGSICIGIAFTAIFCIVGFAASKDVPFWAKLVSWSATICGTVLGFGLFYLDSQQRTNIVQSTDDVTHEMEELERLCQAAEPDGNVVA
jgi:hypothetical protein